MQKVLRECSVRERLTDEDREVCAGVARRELRARWDRGSCGCARGVECQHEDPARRADGQVFGAPVSEAPGLPRTMGGLNASHSGRMEAAHS